MELRNTYISETDKFLFANVWVTLYCNYCCSYCYETSDKPEMFMTEETADKVTDYLLEECKKENLDALWINFHGGEPTLNSKVIKRIVNRILSSGNGIKLHTSMTTNCSVFDEELCSLISELTVSIDGTPEVHNKNRVNHAGAGTFDTSFSNALKYLESYGKSLRLRTVISPNTAEETAESIKFLYSNGFRIIIPGIDYFSEDWTEELFDVLYDQLSEIKELSSEWEEDTVIGYLTETPKEKGKCYVGCDGSNISVDGGLYACTYTVGEPEYRIGDVVSGLDNEAVDRINCISGKDIEECRGCSNYKYCTAQRCLILNRKLTGDYYTPASIICAEENLKLRLWGFI